MVFKKEVLINSLISEGWLKTDIIISAFRKVPREKFVPSELKRFAYVDEPLPIGYGQTISQPLTVAAMTEALGPKKGDKILEVGTGSGYQAAILSEIVGERGKIITTERIPELVNFAKNNLKDYKNVYVVEYDGSKGYPEEAPYDRIIVTASAPKIPEPLIEQLKVNGRMVIPVGDMMFVVDKVKSSKNYEIKKKMIGYYVFVPLIGEYGYK